jgi:hypothetical protein
MSMRQRALGALIGLGLLLHGLAHAVLPMRAAEAVAPDGMTVLYVLAMVGFVAAGLGLVGVAPLRRTIVPGSVVGGICGLMLQLRFFHAEMWPGIVLSTTLPVVAVMYTVIHGIATRQPARPTWKRMGDAAGLACLAWIAAAAVLWPWHRAWGTAPGEWSITLPGDAVPRTPQFEVLHAVTIDAPPSAVWPWLVQIGHDRAGFYSYDWLERLFLADVHNVKELRPEWQSRQAGDRVHATQEGYFGGLFGNRPGWTVTLVEPDRALVLEHWGAFALLPTSDGQTRFLIRSTMSNERIPAWAAAVNMVGFQLPHFIMQRKMMLTIKELAERERPVVGAGFRVAG